MGVRINISLELCLMYVFCSIINCFRCVNKSCFNVFHSITNILLPSSITNHNTFHFQNQCHSYSSNLNQQPLKMSWFHFICNLSCSYSIMINQALFTIIQFYSILLTFIQTVHSQSIVPFFTFNESNSNVLLLFPFICFQSYVILPFLQIHTLSFSNFTFMLQCD